MADPWDDVPVVSRARPAKKADQAKTVDPWDSVPVVAASTPQEPEAAPVEQPQTRNGSLIGDDGKPYTIANTTYAPPDETDEQRIAQGYQQDSDGRWFKMVGPREEAKAFTRAAEAQKPEWQQKLGAFGQAAAEQLPFVDEAAAFTASKLFGGSYDQYRNAEKDLSGFDTEFNRGSQIAGGISGVGAGLAAPGAGYVRGAQGLAAVGRAAQVGAGYGALYGLGAGDGSLADRAPGAALGAAGGAILGAGVQSGVNAIGRIAGISGAGSRAPVTGDPQTRAAIRLSNTMGPGAIAERGRLNDLGLNPSVMDVAGGTTERLVRTAASPAGEGANLAVANAGARQANLRPEAMARTRQLLPDNRSAQEIGQGLREAREALATTEYAPAYQSQVALTPEAARALRGPDGQAAIQRAMLGARANGDVETLGEMQSLMNADLDQLPSVSGRTLDRVRIAMRDMSENFMRGDRPDRVRAGGYAGRVAGIDDALDSAPGLTEARGAYRDRSGAIAAIEDRPDIFTTDPRDFTTWVDGLTGEQRQAAVAGVRQDIMDTLGRQRNAGTGSMDTLTQSQYSQQNLAALLGEQEAARYLNGITARVQQAQRAQRVSPNTNSQTFARGLDENNFQAAEALGAVADGVNSVRGNIPAIARTIDRIRARATMSPQEREAIVRLGLGSANDLERIVMLADQARITGQRVPREVLRYIQNAQIKLGPQLSSELLSALRPAQAAASPEETQPTAD